MKFCTHCGKEIMEEAVICPGCGCAVADVPAPISTPKSSGLVTAAKVFMILGTIIMGIYIAPLAWCIPMTVSYFFSKKPITGSLSARVSKSVVFCLSVCSAVFLCCAIKKTNIGQ